MKFHRKLTVIIFSVLLIGMVLHYLFNIAVKTSLIHGKFVPNETISDKPTEFHELNFDSLVGEDYNVYISRIDPKFIIKYPDRLITDNGYVFIVSLQVTDTSRLLPGAFEAQASNLYFKVNMRGGSNLSSYISLSVLKKRPNTTLNEFHEYHVNWLENAGPCEYSVLESRDIDFKGMPAKYTESLLCNGVERSINFDNKDYVYEISWSPRDNLEINDIEQIIKEIVIE